MRGVLPGVLLVLLLAPGIALACPQESTLINETMVLAGGLCNLSDSGGDGALIISASNILLDCNNTVFNGSGLAGSIGLKASGFQNVTIRNCTFQNYQKGLALAGMRDSLVKNVTAANNTYGMEFLDSPSVSIEGSSLSSLTRDLYSSNSSLSITSTSYTTLKRDWHLSVNVTNTTGQPIAGPLIQLLDSERPLQNATPSSGWTQFTYITEYLKNSSGEFNYTPHTLNVSASGYLANSTQVYLTRSLSILITLNQTPPPDTGAPSISHTLSPREALNGSNVTITATATDDTGLDSVWALIEHPDGSDTLYLNSTQARAYTALRLGRHNVTIFANDTSGNQANATDYFLSLGQINFSVSVTDYNASGLDSELIIYQANTTTQVSSVSSTTGDLTGTVLNRTYDLHFLAFSGGFTILLEDVRLWENLDRSVGMDSLPTPASGYVLTYAAETSYSFSRARVRVYYNDADVSDEGALDLYVCDDWDISARSCPGGWTELNATLFSSANMLEAYVTGFSAFSIMEEGSCGDGACSTGETSSSCPQDCNCTPGETRLCSETYQGICAVGNDNCVDGAWTGCPQPITEVCNRRDDDCNGVVDDLDGGASVEATACACYNGAPPVSETLDQIDNDCDGEIDEGCVCSEGETDVCGSNIGECVPGVMRCSDGCTWGTDCEGVLGPFDEICGNGKDDDCDGTIDEVGSCIIQTDVACSDGEIPGLGCICGGMIYGTGYCCGGQHQEGPCPEFPWWTIILAGAVILAGAFVFYFLYERKKEAGQWESLEKKYSRRQ